MPLVEPKEYVQTFLGTASVIESDRPLDVGGVGGSVILRHDVDEYSIPKLFVHTTANYKDSSTHGGHMRGWQTALTKDQALCLARTLVKMAGEL